MVISDVTVDRMVEISYVDNGDNICQIKSDRPHADFVKSVESLTKILINHLDLFSISSRITATQIETGVNNKGETYYRISGKQNYPKFTNGHDNKISTPKMTEAYDNFFEEVFDFEEQDYRLKHEPLEYPFVLQDCEIEMIEKVLKEAELYIEGKRKPDEQGDLFAEAVPVVDAEADWDEGPQKALPAGTPVDLLQIGQDDTEEGRLIQLINKDEARVGRLYAMSDTVTGVYDNYNKGKFLLLSNITDDGISCFWSGNSSFTYLLEAPADVQQTFYPNPPRNGATA